MSESVYASNRLRAYLQFLGAFLYFFVARSLAVRGAAGLASGWSPLTEQALLVFLLLIGYAGFGIWLDRQTHPIAEQGLPRREGWTREAGMGLATGWAVALVCVLPLTLFGGISVSITPQLSAWRWLLADAAFFALAAMAEEIAFRGYAFQRFERAVGGVGAALGFAAIYAILQALLPGASHSSFAVSFMLALLLSTCYLRTRALWLSWGLNFGWKASRALVFGLAVNGVASHSPVVQGDPMGPSWLTGGFFGLDASWLAFFVLLALLPVVFRLTGELNFRYNAPVLVPAGIPVDIDAFARAQHEAVMGPAAPTAPTLVQIGNAASGEQETGTEGSRNQGDQPTAGSDQTPIGG